jgi:hypothetical protein
MFSVWAKKGPEIAEKWPESGLNREPMPGMNRKRPKMGRKPPKSRSKVA